jgi:hypothetical protein
MNQILSEKEAFVYPLRMYFKSDIQTSILLFKAIKRTPSQDLFSHSKKLKHSLIMSIEFSLLQMP